MRRPSPVGGLACGRHGVSDAQALTGGGLGVCGHRYCDCRCGPHLGGRAPAAAKAHPKLSRGRGGWGRMRSPHWWGALSHAAARTANVGVGPGRGAHTHSRGGPTPDLGEGRGEGRRLNFYTAPPLVARLAHDRVHAATDALGRHVQSVAVPRWSTCSSSRLVGPPAPRLPWQCHWLLWCSGIVFGLPRR